MTHYPMPAMLRRVLFLAIISTTSSAAAAGASGTLTDVLGVPWPVRDALAWHERDYTYVVLTTEPFDWIDFSADGKLDSMDISRHRGRTGALGTIELVFDAKGYFRRWDSDDTEAGVNPVGGWKLAAADATRIAGRFDYASTDGTFDLPILPAALEPAGEPLAAGSEPVRALEAYFAAQRRGNVDAALALSLTPEQIRGVDATQRSKFASALKPSPMSVQRIEFKAGRIAGDVAQIDYAAHGQILDGTLRTARLVRIEGRWIVGTEIDD